ncbi:hypothetical protein [Candidatus Liberibacter americanus]|nr:hypothetical protein [Candidatus Liberibacter americanus]
MKLPIGILELLVILLSAFLKDLININPIGVDAGSYAYKKLTGKDKPFSSSQVIAGIDNVYNY